MRDHALGDLDEREQQLRVRQIVVDGVGDSRILHLDGDFGAVMRAGQVHLADRRSSDRRWRELGEDLLGRTPELALDHGGGEYGLHRLGVGLQGGQRTPVDLAVLATDRRAHVDEREDLPDLHEHALRARQRVGVPLSVADVELRAGAPLAAEPAPQHVGNAPTGRSHRHGGERSRAPQPTLGNRHRLHLTRH